MSFLTRLNPARSLFFRVFLWFWLATFLIFMSSTWLVQQLDSGVKYRPLKPNQAKNLHQVARKFQYQIDKHDVDLNKYAFQMSKRNRFWLVLVDAETSKVIFGLKKEQLKTRQLLEQFDEESSALMIETQGKVYIGPSSIVKNQKAYLLYTANNQPGGSLRVIRHEYPGLFLFFLILFSGGLCYLFVRSLLKPVIQLQRASRRMAKGDLAARVGSASNRLDEIGQLGRDFNLMSEKVEILLNGQKRLLADISHELRSPLARLQLSIGIAQQQPLELHSTDSQLALDRIEKEANQIESMIAQVLMLSKLDSQEAVLNKQNISFEQLMLPIINDANFEAKQRGKNIQYNAQVSCDLFVDAQLLTSAIENVIRNAIHYSNDNIQVSVIQYKKTIVWSIKDDGKGMEEQQLSRVFEPFYRSSTARDRNSGGVGLGLAIAYRAVKQHQGDLTARNIDNGGLEVSISIPIDSISQGIIS
ncbi:ATP-binding protein [Paraglaciecola aquimarina]|uniref:histidine kinase n=1 Tax=Paraglaciecola algarum TaxID=3050085 RepID=A0ABS9D9B5_9ALTE|nr:ATP-binding protein [Paraglaciecola sp. G1-23]MCF2949324.1 ATP-binding protein [Paraglaciecola sp. G1-23]